MHIPCIWNNFKRYIQKNSIGHTLYMLWILHIYFVYVLVIYPYETRKYCWQVKDVEHRLRHKLFPANAWMKFFHCTLHPIGTVAGIFNSSDEDIPLDLIFFSPFEEPRMRTNWIMESKGIHRVYEASITSPRLFPLSTSGGLRTSSAEFHSFHAFWTEMQPQHITHKYSSRQKDAAVPMVLAQPR